MRQRSAPVSCLMASLVLGGHHLFFLWYKIRGFWADGFCGIFCLFVLGGGGVCVLFSF